MHGAFRGKIWGNTEYRRWRKMKNQQYHYLCLIEELRKRLQNGQLHAGDVLPSEQEWAEALSIKKRDVRPI